MDTGKADRAVHPAVVYQAQGMVAVQARCPLDAALALLQDTADASDVTLTEIARGVIEHRVTFDPPT